jgi:hypothetical protein
MTTQSSKSDQRQLDEDNADVSIVRHIAVVIGKVIWAIAGFYIWIPAILISVPIFTAGVFASAFTGHNHLLRLGERLLRRSVNLYPNGFAQIEARAKAPDVVEDAVGFVDAMVDLIKLTAVAVVALLSASLVWALLVILGILIRTWF